MKTKLAILSSIALAVVFFGGCASQNATYVESGGSQSLLSTNKINIADWNAAAAALVNDMMASGVMNRFPEKPVRMKVSRIVNRTSEQIDTELLTKQISIALLNSGNVVTMSDDEYTQELAKQQAFMADKQMPLPKVTLTGRIVEDRESVGKKREVTYVFMLSLNHEGVGVWEGQKQLTKQSNRGSFAF